MSRFRYGVFPYITPGGEERGKGVQIEILTSDRQILSQTDDQIMKVIDKFVRRTLSSRRLYLQAEHILNGDEKNEQD